jgi:REP element-mobilizing transposase RayT
MPGHVFHEIYIHLNWHTKDDQPLLTPEIEPLVHNYLRQKCGATKGVTVHGTGGTADHVHLAVSIEPFVCISDLVGEVKGSSSHDVRDPRGMKAVEWQRGFGVVSFGKKNLRWVLDYVAHQKEHHAAGTCEGRLEKVGEEGTG